jgi:hypothetical protein
LYGPCCRSAEKAFSQTLESIYDHNHKEFFSHTAGAKQKSESIAHLRVHQATEEEGENKKFCAVSEKFVVFPEQEHRNCYREYLDHSIGN